MTTPRESDSLYLQAVVSALPIALWALDRHGIVTLSEGRLLDRFGLRRGQLVGQSLLELYRDHPDVLEWVERALKGESVHFTLPYMDGVLEIWYSPLLDDAGEPAGTIGIAMEITDRVRLEEQFRHAQKMEAIGRLAGGVAHDFNNLLTAIIGYAELALAALPPDSEVRTDIQEILAAGRSAAGLTRQLLAFSRRQVMQPQVLDLNDTIERLRGLLTRVIGEDVVLLADLDPGLHAVYADPTQIEQIVMNLVVNARDAMPSGGQLMIETRNVERSEMVLLAVTDSGAGMSAEVQRQIFEPFFTTKPRGEGTGLGLSTVYGIVTQSGGTITLQSEIGRGTRFEILLPVHAGARDGRV